MSARAPARAMSPEDCARRSRRRSFGATVRISSVSSTRSAKSRSRSRPRMIIVRRDSSASRSPRPDSLDGATSDGQTPDSSLNGDDVEPPRLPVPFAPPSLSKPAPGRPMKAAWGELPPVPTVCQPDEVDEQDKNTPDNWVCRDSSLVRLTGKHPFNCEAKLDKLFAAGFLTPSSLFYVRNHGAVPRIDAEAAANWRLRIHGLVEHELNLSIAELQQKLETVTLPVTLVCAGNRRKEQNLVRKGLGFNWGSAGVSNALFTGVYVADLLKLVKPKKGARYVIYEGNDKLPKGPYGTSQHLANSRNRDKGHMIAWAMNGLPLEPDHGFPLRLIVPGQIGGRMVKWLNRIEISKEESQHYLHFRDNKVLPMQLLPDQARAEDDWWMDPRYTIYDLSVNSAIAVPNHDEVLDCSSVKSDEETFDLRGYAYAGGGQRISRVEISIDDGETWLLAHITYPEDLYREVTASDPVYGTLDLSESIACYSWCFWTFRCPIMKLKTTSVIMCRAMDSAMNMQPRDMYWNSTSMLNNWWHRIAVHRETDDKGVDRIRFEHPVMAGVVSGGWMSRMQDEGLDIFKPVFAKAGDSSAQSAAPPPAKKKVVESLKKEGVDRMITRGELEEHANEKEPWFVVNGEVYEGTNFLEKHPGGGESITLVAGEDASEDFMAIHSSDAKRQLVEFHIGTLEKGGESTEAATDEVDGPDTPFLHKSKWRPAKLVDVTPVSHDSRIFRFALSHPEQPLGLPIGAHCYTRLKRKVLQQKQGEPDGVTELVEGDSWTQRAYTPVSLPDARGFIDLLIKIYFPADTFEGGKMTIGFNELQIGDTIECKGPIGHFHWLGDGLALWKNVERRVRKVGMICGGSGVTPILQVLRGIFMNTEDKETKVWLVDSNKEESDILCRKELDGLLEEHKDRYQLHYALSRPPEGWQGTKGRLNEKTLREHLPPPGDDTLILICGPETMISHTVKPALTSLGFDVPNQLVVF